MQAVMVIPFGSEAMLTRKVAGVPLLLRVLATAVRAGVKDLILVWPADADPAIWDQCVTSRALRGLQTRTIRGLPFEPRDSGDWAAIGSLLNDEFLWLPWNFVTAARFLKAVKTSADLPLSWKKPVRLVKDLIDRSPRAGIGTDSGVNGISIHSSNIQIADLNALNAALAVIKWKKLMGFYQDLDFEHHCTYTIGGNMLRNEDAPGPELTISAGHETGKSPRARIRRVHPRRGGGRKALRVD